MAEDRTRGHLFELFFDEFEGILIITTTRVLGKAYFGVDRLDFLAEEILFVQKQHYFGLGKELAIANFVKQTDRLVHSVDLLVLKQSLIVLGKRHKEEHSVDGLETVNPLSPLRPL